jgi:hypothetical protein
MSAHWPAGRSSARAAAADPLDVRAPSGPQSFRSVPEDEPPMVSERTPGGLPQRRRNRPAPVDRSGFAGPARHAAPTGHTDTEVQPGMWLSAFQAATSTRAPVGGPAVDASDESSVESDEVE